MPTVVQGAERFFERAEVREAMVALRAATRTADESRRPAGDRRRGAGGGRLAARRPPPGGGAARERWEAVAALVEDFGASRVRASRHSRSLGRVRRGAGPAGRACSTRRRWTVSRWRACTRPRAWSGTRSSWSAWSRACCRPRTRRRRPRSRRSGGCCYVGITRARQWLTLSYAAPARAGGRARRPSRFLPVEESDRGRPAAGAGASARRRRHPAPRHRRAVPGLRGDPHRAGRPQARPVRDLSIHNGRRAVRAAAGVAARGRPPRRASRRTSSSPTPR